MWRKEGNGELKKVMEKVEGSKNGNERIILEKKKNGKRLMGMLKCRINFTSSLSDASLSIYQPLDSNHILISIHA